MTDSADRNPKPKQMILVRELSGAPAVEDHLLLFSGNRNSGISAETSALLDKFSTMQFGVCSDDTFETLTDTARQQLDDPDELELLEDYLDGFETREADEEEVIKILLSHGIDFRDVNGHPMRMTRYLKCVAEGAAKGIFGKLPSTSEMHVEKWAADLLNQANNFTKNKITKNKK